MAFPQSWPDGGRCYDRAVETGTGEAAPAAPAEGDMGADDQKEVIAFPSDPGSHGGTAPVETIHTHISIVFLAGERAIKLKRAVRLPYVDFSMSERRRQACEAELQLNRRTAPELYIR